MNQSVLTRRPHTVRAWRRSSRRFATSAYPALLARVCPRALPIFHVSFYFHSIARSLFVVNTRWGLDMFLRCAVRWSAALWLARKFCARLFASLPRLVILSLIFARRLLRLLDESLLPKDNTTEGQVFYSKMAGDYYRYLAEFATADDRKTKAQSAQRKYEEATKTGQSLPATNPIRLGLALNYSVFYYEILNAPQEACTLAKSAFDDAISELDRLPVRAGAFTLTCCGVGVSFAPRALLPLWVLALFREPRPVY